MHKIFFYILGIIQLLLKYLSILEIAGKMQCLSWASTAPYFLKGSSIAQLVSLPPTVLEIGGSKPDANQQIYFCCFMVT
jgi:hypothetical protein